MSLSPEQRAELQRLLTDELRAAVRAATDRGAGAAGLTGLLDERRRAVESLATGPIAAGPLAGGSLPADDADRRRDDPASAGGVGEQR